MRGNTWTKWNMSKVFKAHFCAKYFFLFFSLPPTDGLSNHLPSSLFSSSSASKQLLYQKNIWHFQLKTFAHPSPPEGEEFDWFHNWSPFSETMRHFPLHQNQIIENSGWKASWRLFFTSNMSVSSWDIWSSFNPAVWSGGCHTLEASQVGGGKTWFGKKTIIAQFKYLAGFGWQWKVRTPRPLPRRLYTVFSHNVEIITVRKLVWTVLPVEDWHVFVNICCSFVFRNPIYDICFPKLVLSQSFPAI